MQNDLLIEIGSEELPPKAGLNTLTVIAERLEKQLKQAGLSFESLNTYHAPRRLAFYVTKLEGVQSDQTIHRQGPFLNKAYDDKQNPTPALIGFAKSCGVEIDDLLQEDSDKGRRVAFNQLKKGQALSQLLPEMLQKCCHNLPIPRLMRWGSGKTSFIRPVHSLVVLFGDQVINCELFDCQSGRQIMGHPVMHSQPIELKTAEDYVSVMEKAFVLVDAEARRQRIVAELQSVAKKEQATVVMSEALLDEVNQLVSWPVALKCQFDPKFLTVPSEVLIKAMESHQKCFALTDAKGQLLPQFVTLANLESTDPKQVILGNERVMKARLSDAQFFFEKDCQVPLADWVEGLNHITFEKRLGSLGEKVKRLESLAQSMAKELKLDQAVIKRIATLCKADLVSDMVGEFPSLQGTMGRHYAKLAGEPEAVAQGIEAHYWPRFAEDRLPQDQTSAVVGIADRLDTLVGIFSVGMAPTGDKDPYALRRAALGLSRLLIELKLPLDLKSLLSESLALYQQDESIVEDLLSFVFDRLKAWYGRNGISSHLFEAVRVGKVTHPLDFHRRIEAVKAFSQLPEAQALVEANKRVYKILAKNAATLTLPQINEKSLLEQAEKDLYQALCAKMAQTESLVKDHDYQAYLAALVDLKQPIDQFFDQVMVMTEDEGVRLNRLALLAKLRGLFVEVADISCLAFEPEGR